MNKYGIWIGLALTFLFALTVNSPLWFVVLAIGIAANGLVVTLNKGKMPVYGRCEESARHQSMGPWTKQKWLADIIPIGIGKASVGDFLICAGLLGIMATGALEGWLTPLRLFIAGGFLYWFVGWAGGFKLLGKAKEWRREAQKNFPIALMMLLVGHLLGVRGCDTGTLRALTRTSGEVTVKSPLPKWRSLGPILLPPRRIKPLSQIEREQQADLAKLEEQEKTQLREDVRASIAEFSRAPEVLQHSGSRKGPFCRITCTVHHDDHYDVEVLPELCKVNWIPPDTTEVPGWWHDSTGRWEEMNLWPGPAQAGFHSYKLYWGDK